VVEALARSGLGALTLVDLDDVCISNVNRQLHALDGTFGRHKVDVMEQRVRAIHPDCHVHARTAFFTKGTADELLEPHFHYVIDAIDRPAHKCLLAAKCAARKLPLLMIGGAGGRQDPTLLRIADLAHATHDRLLTAVRRELRTDYGFPKPPHLLNIECVYSIERPVFPQADGSVCQVRPKEADLRLDCSSGYGTAAFVTGAFGLVAAAQVVRRLGKLP
jgi:tRNA A37 threonylcarbamoyladenosine dehydratase